MHAPRLAAGDLFEVRVVQNYVGRDLLAPRLIPTPGPQKLEELRIYRIGGSAGRPVRHLYRTGAAVHDGDARLGGRPGGRGSVFREDRGSVGLSEAHLFEPDVHEGALGQSLHELVRHELEEGRLSDDGPQARATSQLQQGYRPAAG